MALISGSEIFLSMSDGQMINLDVGHIHLGTGCPVPQHFVKANYVITGGRISFNPSLCRIRKLAVQLCAAGTGKYVDITVFSTAVISGAVHNIALCNYADCDIAGRAGILDAAIQMIERASLGRPVISGKELDDEQMLVTIGWDSGRQAYDDNIGQPFWDNSVVNAVKPLYIDEKSHDSTVAISSMFGIPQPVEMEIRSLSSFA